MNKNSLYDHDIDGLHVTSWRSCWCTGTRRCFSSGNKLPFLYKLCEQILFCFVLYTNMAVMQTTYRDAEIITTDDDPQRKGGHVCDRGNKTRVCTNDF